MKVCIENIDSYGIIILWGCNNYVSYWKRYKSDDKTTKEEKGIFLKPWDREWKTKEESRENNK